MSGLSKSLRKEVADIVAKAYKIEMNRELNKLYEKFKKWEEGTYDCWELHHDIHLYHDGAGRELYKLYQAEGLWLVERAVFEKIINMKQLSDALKSLIEQSLARHKARNS